MSHTKVTIKYKGPYDAQIRDNRLMLIPIKIPNCIENCPEVIGEKSKYIGSRIKWNEITNKIYTTSTFPNMY